MVCAALKPTALSEMVQSCVARAIGDCGHAMKSAASEMDVPISLLCEGLKGEKHLSLQRLSLLGQSFLLHFCKRVMADLGGVALSAEEVALVRGAAALGPKRMAKMTAASLPQQQERA